ncbi:hypothetical protein LDG_7325 [Legionella drancourtii LLAP12]|uniref:Uncharacterized protein n=2 Tax=Legionella drancourtii TaxID=168933 RepID=G9EPY4_9GAMM|nr:hypothetical protein LDG_7325 [Legionella drancourtii LLAP12]
MRMRFDSKAINNKKHLGYAATLITKLLEFTECTPYYRVDIQQNSMITVRESTKNHPDAQAKVKIQQFKNALQKLDENGCFKIQHIAIKAKPINKEEEIKIPAMQITEINRMKLADLLGLKEGINNVNDTVWEALCNDKTNTHKP